MKIVKIGKDENINMDTLGKIYEYFQYDIGDILEYKICESLRKELRG